MSWTDHELTEEEISELYALSDEMDNFRIWDECSLDNRNRLTLFARYAYDRGKQAAQNDDGFIPESDLDNVRKGDTLRRVWIANGVVNTAEGIADHWQSGMYWATKEGTPIVGGNLRGHILRKPAPVVHPDPEKHPVILDGNGDVWIAFSGGYSRPGKLWEFPESFGNDWTPAEVVAKEDY